MKRMIDGKFVEFFEQNASVNGDDLSLTGDVAVGGNLATNGYITPGSYELDQDITVGGLSGGIYCYYAHARVSNGKFNLVVALYLEANAAQSEMAATKVSTIPLPDDVYSRLYPYLGTDQGALNTQEGHLTSLGSGAASGATVCQLVKEGSNNLSIFIRQEAVSAATAARDVRFEFNFLLS